jgi:hypothetical protein
MLVTIVILIVALVAALLLYAASRPDTFRIQRSATMQAPPERIFPHLDSLKAWGPWSPWEKLDPDLRRTFSGPDSGKGATYEWEGNNKVGKGRMEILDSAPPLRLSIKLDFLKPFEAHNTAEFNLVPEGGATRVDWAMYGPSPFMSKLMGLFFNMDRMVGKDFEAGLASLKAIAERPGG